MAKYFTQSLEEEECMGGARYSGLKDMCEYPANVQSGAFMVPKGLYKNIPAVQRSRENETYINPGIFHAISFAPLNKAEFEPDVIFMVCNAKQGMEILHANAYDSGDHGLGADAVPVCTSMAATPYMTGKVTYGFGDVAARKNMDINHRDIYDAPANVFVAGFIGQPAMNMIDAVVHGGILAADPFRIPLPADWPHRVEGSALTLGIRPEHIRVSRPSGRARSGVIADGMVRLVERGSGHPWVTLEPASGRATGRMLVALLDSGQELRAGDAVTISIGDAVFHFFNPVTGARIGGRRVGPGERPG